MGFLDIIGATAQAANNSAMDQIEERAKKAVATVEEHKRMDRRFPCAHLHFDVIEAILALAAKGDIPYQAVKALTRMIFISVLSGSVVGGGVVAGGIRLAEKMYKAHEIRQASLQDDSNIGTMAKEKRARKESEL